jgi:uncharacterized membrane protein
MLPEAPISPETFLQGSGRMEFVIRATTNWHDISAFGGLVLIGPLCWGFSDRAGCRILPFVGYLGILIPDIDHRLNSPKPPSTRPN